MKDSEKMLGASVLLLKQANIQVTPTRIAVLEVFLHAGHAMNQSAVYRLHRKEMDRTTIYRTLQLFIQKKLLYIMPTADNVIWYALHKMGDPPSNHYMLLFCDKCCQVIDSKSVTKIKDLKVPREFKLGNVEVIIRGLCKNCQR